MEDSKKILALLAISNPDEETLNVWANMPYSVWAKMPYSFWENMPYSFWVNMPDSVWANMPDSFWANMPDSVWVKMPDSVWANMPYSVWANMPYSVWAKMPYSFWANMPDSVWANMPDSFWAKMPYSFWAKIKKLIDEIPMVDKFYSKLWNDIQNEKRSFDQSTFGELNNPVDEIHLCNTPMCTAGNIVNMAGQKGYELKNLIGFAGAATLIHKKWYGDLPQQNYGSISDEMALAFIEMNAERESKE